MEPIQEEEEIVLKPHPNKGRKVYMSPDREDEEDRERRR